MMWENMKGKTKKLYEAMWPENDFDGIITPSSDKKSSYHFLQGGKDVDERLLEIFSINNEKNKKQFKEKFKMAISGSGQENAKITTLHSSSLCCLLFFYNVNNDNSLTLSLKTNKGEKSVTFTESVFEFKNIVTLNENAPSNVDVVLIGEDETKNKVILFLESKLSEYYLETPVNAKPKFDIGKGYFNKEWKYYMLYKTILEQMRKHCEICIEPNNEEEEVHRLIGEERFYIKGLMQIFSHYIGIRNLMDGN